MDSNPILTIGGDNHPTSGSFSEGAPGPLEANGREAPPRHASAAPSGWLLAALASLSVHALLFGLVVYWIHPAAAAPGDASAIFVSLLAVPGSAAGSGPGAEPKLVAPLAPPRAAPIEPLPLIRPKPQAQVPATVKADPAPAEKILHQYQAGSELQKQAGAAAGRSENSIANEDTGSEEAASASPSMPGRGAEGTSGGSGGGEASGLSPSVPLYARNPPPDYPPLARRRNNQGTVLLDVLVDRQGRPSQVKVARSSGYPILDQSALASVRQWRFEPAHRSGRPVEMWVQVPVRFALE